MHLRHPDRKEMPFIQELWSDQATMDAVGGTHSISAEEFDRWFAHMVDPGTPENCYYFVFNQNNTPVGEVSFHKWNPYEQSAVLNIKVMAKYRNHGYGADALKVFLSWFFNRAGGKRMTDDLALDNRSGQGLLLSLGFEQVNNRKPVHDCQSSDVYMLDMTKEMFESKHG